MRAYLFDLDGVLTPTADLHMVAWKQLFTTFFTDLASGSGRAAAAGLTPREVTPYTDADYFEHLDGKRRPDGVRSVLASRGITADEVGGEDAYAPLVDDLGARKNEEFRSALAKGIDPYPGSVAFLDALAAQTPPAPVAVVSSSRNAVPVLTAAGLIDRFEVIVDGEVAAEEHLPGKPAPDTFQRGAELLGVPVDEAIVVEDAVSGVRAGAAGGFVHVIGVDRGAGSDALRAAGADVIVDDLLSLVSRIAELDGN